MQILRYLERQRRKEKLLTTKHFRIFHLSAHSPTPQPAPRNKIENLSLLAQRGFCVKKGYKFFFYFVNIRKRILSNQVVIFKSGCISYGFKDLVIQIISSKDYPSCPSIRK